ncbi:uncharacterized protein LOC129395909 [Pan paniscus]|uniref:uncharacterized protein LOC129395909 n=1 Tax=Pan paniscus TaxID=9597 RepID=UPI0030065299
MSTLSGVPCLLSSLVRETTGLQPGWGGEEMQGLARAGLAKGKGQGLPGPEQVRAAQARVRRVRGARERPAVGAREPEAARGGARAGPDAQLRAARTQQARAQTPQLRREAVRAGCFFFPKCRQSPWSHGQPFRQLRSHWQASRQGWPAQEGGGRRSSRREEAAAVAGGEKRTAPGLRGRGGRAAAGQGGDRHLDRWRRQRIYRYIQQLQKDSDQREGAMMMMVVLSKRKGRYVGKRKRDQTVTVST